MMFDALMDNEQVDEMVDQSLGYRLYDNTQQSDVHLIGASTLSPTITCRGSNGPYRRHPDTPPNNRCPYLAPVLSHLHPTSAVCHYYTQLISHALPHAPASDKDDLKLEKYIPR